MIANDVVLQTVKRMISSGVDDDTIKMTLKGINLSEDEIKEFMREAKGETSRQEQDFGDAAQSVEEDMGGGEGQDIGDEDGGGGFDEEGAADELHGHIESAAQEQLGHHAETHQILQEHAEKISAVHENVGALHGKVDSLPRISTEAMASLFALDRRISSLEKSVGEAVANTAALKSLMQKIIDSQRQIIMELQKKK